MSDTHVDQVGGSHYQAQDGDQHWDVMERNDVAYLEATATKYLMRWRKKGTPRVDLGKAASYLEKAIKCRPGQGARRLVPAHEVEAMCTAAGVHWMDRDIIMLVLCSGAHHDFEQALEAVRDLEQRQS